MSDPQQTQIEQQVRELATLKEDDLYRKLGEQMRQAELAAADDPEALAEAQAKGAFATPKGVEMGLGENLREFGRRWWGQIEPQLYKLLCSADNPQRDEILAALPASKGGTAPAATGGATTSASADTIALALAPLLISLLPFSLSIIASTAATIAAKMIISSGLKTTCEMWQESIEAREKEAAAANPPAAEGAPGDAAGSPPGTAPAP
ncbi:MAG TPA: hypothetical protein VGE07_12740 [Herpetosiphonaceae bacterium]